MNAWPANDAILLGYGGITVALRPSLRAALRIERLHQGFTGLLQKIDQFDTATVRSVILAAAEDRGAAERLLYAAAGQPLAPFAEAAQGALLGYCEALLLFPEADDAKGASPTPDKPMAWADLYRELYRLATGWLGWTPATTWNATPSEIIEAFEGHVAKLKAMNGAGDDEPKDGPTAEQRASNIAQGLDPDFDRAGLAKLRSMQ